MTDAPQTIEPPLPARAGSARRAGRTSPRARAALNQIVLAVLTIIAISIVTFAATNLHSPTEVARNALGRSATPAALQKYVDEHALDRPAPERYWHWAKGLASGDWGVSALTNRPVKDDVMPRLTKTVLLALAALVIGVPISVALGVFMARRYGGARDMALLTSSVVVAALPEFVVGIGLLYLFAVKLGWLPVDSSALAFGTTSEKIEAFVLPTLTLVLAMVPYVSRIARASLHDVLGAPYVRAAVLRGLSRRTVVWDHGMRNAGVPLVNAIALNLVLMLSGVIVVENLFAFPGVGQALVQAISTGDTLTVQAIAVVMGVMFVAISLIADLAAVYFNPRLKSTQP